MTERSVSDRTVNHRPASRRAFLGTLASLAAAGGLGGCAQLQDPASPDPKTTDGGTTARRLVSHEFVPVGETRSLGDIGAVLEVIEFDGQLDLDTEAGTFTPIESGVTCIRARYRESERQNAIQTKCVLGIDEAGSCDGYPRYAFDLQRFTDRAGNSNWLAQGNGRFYGVCRTDTGLQLEPNTRDLPPLYFGIVDALGDGAYSLGPSEFARQRHGTIRTYSGDVIEPSWVVFLGPGPPGSGTITDAGKVEIEIADCTKSPSCTVDPTFVRPGDIVEVTPASIGSFAAFRERYGVAKATERLNTLLDRHGITAFEWESIDERLGPFDDNGSDEGFIEIDIKPNVFERLVRLQALERTLEFFDEVHGLHEKGVAVSLTDDLNNAPVKCPFPNPEAQAICEEFEAAVAAAEDLTLAELGRTYDLWLSIDAWEQPGQHRPKIENADGIVFRAGFSGETPVKEDLRSKPLATRDWLVHLTDQRPDLPIVQVLQAPVSVVNAEGDQCEAEYCPSNFEVSFRLNEALLEVALETAGNQLAGIAVKTFEGAHFDIRNPVEDRSGYELNRIGETGYNNPILNVYAAQ